MAHREPVGASLLGQAQFAESYGLWGAAMRATNTPRTPMRAGRIAFIFEPAYLGGTLFMGYPPAGCSPTRGASGGSSRSRTSAPRRRDEDDR